MDSATAAPDVSTENQGPVAPPSWADSQPAQPTAQPPSAAQQPMQMTPSDSSATKIPEQPQPQYSQPPVTITPQKRGGILGVVDSVMDALTGTTKPEIATGSDGNKYVNQAPIGHAAQWARLGSEALQGAAAGMAAGRGNNAGGAFAAGVNKGVDIGNQRAQAPQKLSEEAQQANLEKANMQMVTMRNAQLAWTLKHEQVQASEEAVKFAEDQADYMEKSGAVMLGHMGDHGDLNDVLKNDPDAAKSLVQDSTIKTVPTFDAKGNPTGVDVYKVTPDFNKEMLPAGTTFNTFDPTTGKQVVNKSSAPMTRGQKYVYDSTAANAEMEFRKKQSDIEKEQAETQAEKDKSANAGNEQAKTKAETAKAYADAAKASAEARNERMGLAPNGTSIRSTGMDPLNAADHDEIVQGLLDGTLDDKKVFAYKGAALRPQYIADAKRIDPSWSEAKFDAMHKTQMEFASTEGNHPGAQISSFNYMVGHAGDFMSQIAQLRNTNSPLLNRPMNWLAKNADGNAAVASVYTPMDNLRTEFQHFIEGSALTETDKKEAKKKLDEDMTPAQMEGVTKEMLATGAIRLGSLNQAYHRTVGKDYPGLLDPTTQEILKNAAAGTDPRSRNLAMTMQRHLPQSAFAGQSQSKAAQPAPPPGAIGKVPGSDGKMHWTDGKNDLGVAQ